MRFRSCIYWLIVLLLLAAAYFMWSVIVPWSTQKVKGAASKHLSLLRPIARRRLNDGNNSAIYVMTLYATFNGVEVRIYLPNETSSGLRGGLVYFHGGCWIWGSLDGGDYIPRRLSRENDVVVVSVGYRLAPKAPFPLPFNDCLNATKYFISHAKQFNVDPQDVGVIGDSAGGNLAAAVALQLRDFTPSLRVQVLLCPVMQGLDFQLPSMMQFRSRGPLSAKVMAHCVAMYLEGSSTNQDIYFQNNHVSPAAKREFSKSYLNVDRLPDKYRKNYTRTDLDTGDAVYYEKIKTKLLDPYFSPLVAASVRDLPPAFVYTAEYDPLRDEALLYVVRLRDAGNNLIHVHNDVTHNIITDKCFQDIATFLWNNL